MRLTLHYPIKPWTPGQKFGENFLPLYKSMGLRGHNGIDIGCQDGTPIYAAHDGIVTFTGEDGSGGLGVVIRTLEKFEWEDQGTQGKSLVKSIYWHLKSNTFKVKPGDIVKSGDIVALADNTGASTGTHLHFGIKPIAQGEQEWQYDNVAQSNGYNGAIDPMPYLTGYNMDNRDVFRNVMKQGQRSGDIIRLQNILKELGYFPREIESTGYYGNETRKAVFQFQFDHKVASILEIYALRGTQAGPKTLLKLNNL